MTLELWLAFVVTYSIITFIPGPSVLMVTNQALTRGGRAAFLCVLGELLGGVVVVTLSLFGVGAILATSAELFLIVKWAGVFYMAYLGYTQLKQASDSTPQPPLPNQRNQ
jgi:homoserine/homoserine lactone efflux protein